MLNQNIDIVGLRKTTAKRKKPHDAATLATALAKEVDGEIRFDEGSRALYATDASNYRQVPIGVVVPRTNEAVIETVRICREHDAPILSRGGGTSLCGQTCNVAVVIDFSKYLNRILWIDPERKLACVQPGVVLDDLRDAAREHGLTFAPDPATHTHNTLGGMIGNNSCGPHSVMGGETVRNIAELEVLTYDGARMRVGATSDPQFDVVLKAGGRPAEIYTGLKALSERYAESIRQGMPRIPRRVSGYGLEGLLPERNFNIAHVLVGTEGTCAVTLEATVRLIDQPAEVALLVLGYPSVYEAADHVTRIMEFKPIALEGLDHRLVEDMKAVHIHPHDVELLPEGKGWLLVEFGGATRDEACAQASRAMDALKQTENPPAMCLFQDRVREKEIWRVREAGLGATAHVPDKRITWEGWEDSAVPPEKLGEYLRKLRALFNKYGYACDLYGHFGQGCVHTRVDFDLETAAGIAKWRKFLDEAAHLVVSLGGSISGEHGDGQSKAELLPIMYSPELMQAFREFKGIWDPQGKMNPGKVVDAYRVDENLRLGSDYDPLTPATHFHYPADHGNFSRAMLRCVGVGECRKKTGVMCPSYKVTGEEMHSTRGRARLLFEMLQGDPLDKGWQEPAVHEALELCLSCKGCKGECPVKVDMATYKAEFMSHYYQEHRRPIAAYAFGWIDRWAQLASRAPSIANFFTQTEVFAAIAKRVIGIAPERRIPPFAKESFTRGFARRATASDNGPPVILWPDTFNNYYHPTIAHDAVKVLRTAGCTVQVPRTHLCCGRPLYEFGFLDLAKTYLERVLETLADDLHRGTPIVMLEPACLSVFREELPNLLPSSEQAKRLREQSFLLSEFLIQHAPSFPFRRLNRSALVQGHCHHQSVLGMTDEKKVLEKIGVDFDLPDSGCCGMAGSFGFQAKKYAVSMRCGERVLLPAVRSAEPDRLLIADGYSCREQIAQSTNREALHLAQVLAMSCSMNELGR